MIKFRLVLLSILTIGVNFLNGQVSKNVVVEHFTNSVCSICASRNPGFFSNLANNPDIIHIAVHPSSPYSSCIFNQANPSENDARTNYYNIYGATPRHVIQGDVQPGTVDLNSSTLFDPYRGETSPIDMRITQTRPDPGTVEVTLIMKSVSTPSPDRHQLFFALAEDTVFYNAPNGEDVHLNVFRKRLTLQGYPTYTMPPAGDSIILVANYPIDAGWNADRLFAVAILSDSASKEVVQAVQSTPGFDNNPTFVRDPIQLGIEFYPNPTAGLVEFTHPSGLRGTLLLRNAQGQTIGEREISPTQILDLTPLPSGLYFLEWQTTQGRATARLQRQ